MLIHYVETECRMVRGLQAPGQNKSCGHLFLEVCLIAQGGLDLTLDSPPSSQVLGLHVCVCHLSRL